MKSIQVGYYSVPDGFNGHRADVHLLLCGSRLIEVTPTGFHNSALCMDVQDEREAHWLIENHPVGKKRYHKVARP